MAFTQTDLDVIDRAIVSGELEIEVNGQRVKYRSVAELQAARATVAGALQAAGTIAHRTTTVRLTRGRD